MSTNHTNNIINAQPSFSHSKPRQWKSMLIYQGKFAAQYSLHLLASQIFEFLICILLVLQIPLIHCTNLICQGRLSRHITSSSEKTCLESWPGKHMGKANPFWQLSSSHRCHQPNLSHSNPRQWKSMLIHQGCDIYTLHLLASQSFEFLICILIYYHSKCRYYVAPTYFTEGDYPVT